MKERTTPQIFGSSKCEQRWNWRFRWFLCWRDHHGNTQADDPIQSLKYYSSGLIVSGRSEKIDFDWMQFNLSVAVSWCWLDDYSREGIRSEESANKKLTHHFRPWPWQRTTLIFIRSLFARCREDLGLGLVLHRILHETVESNWDSRSTLCREFSPRIDSRVWAYLVSEHLHSFINASMWETINICSFNGPSSRFRRNSRKIMLWNSLTIP